MLARETASRRLLPLAAIAAWALLLPGCNRGADTSIIGTFRMGERVQLGPLVYNVLEADWKAALTDGGRAPKHRFLFIRLSMTNGGGEPVSVPALELQATDGTRYQEVTEQMGAVPNWLGLLRTLRPAEARQGVIVFDAPMAAYKLVLTDAGEVGSEKFALVEIPVLLE